MNILYEYTIPEALIISGHTIEARRRPPSNCFTARRLHHQWRCLYHVFTTCTQAVVNDRQDSRSSVRCGRSSSRHNTGDLCYDHHGHRPRRHGCGDRNSKRWHDRPDSHRRRQARTDAPCEIRSTALLSRSVEA